MSEFPSQVFRAYDIRGIRDTEIDADFVRNLGRSLVAQFKSSKVVVGRDARPSSQEFTPLLIEGLTMQGADVLDIGMVPTELIPITAGLTQTREAIIITASHNPPEYIGFKLLTDYGAKGITEASGRREIQNLMQHPDALPNPGARGKVEQYDPWPDYREHLRKLVPDARLQKPLSLLAEAGNGMGGAIIEGLLGDLPITVKGLLLEPDGNYPVHTPNPILPKARKMAEREAREHKYDLTVMFDGDADRAAFLDENGQFIASDYFDTLIMDKMIHPIHPNSPVVVDYRRGMVTEAAAKTNGYSVYRTKAGYPNMKEAMCEHKAQFGFEASAHTMYADTFYAESSGLTLLYLLAILNQSEKTLSQLIAPYREKVVLLDEVNYRVKNPQALYDVIKATFPANQLSFEDGTSITTPTWHTNIRGSNTEPLIRLNLEATSQETLEREFQALEKLIIQSEGQRSDH